MNRLAAPTLVGLVLAAGCGEDVHEYFLLEPGKEWHYTARTAFLTYVEPIRVTRKVSVEGVEGYELSGPLGASRLAWKKGGLLLEQFPTGRFRPAITLVKPGEKADIKWEGILETNGATYPATGTIKQKEEKIQIRGRSILTLLSTVTVLTAGRKIELETWFERGVGPVRQQKRTNGAFNFSMELLSQ